MRVVVLSTLPLAANVVAVTLPPETGPVKK